MASSLILEQFLDPMTYPAILCLALWGGAAGYLFMEWDAGNINEITAGMQFFGATVYLRIMNRLYSPV